MSISDSTNFNETQNKEIWIPCYEIVQCQGCKTISFRRAWRDFNDVFDDGGGFVNEIDIIYPGRVGRHPLKDSRQLPSTILSIYDETHAALCNKLHVLTGMGIRALIEAVCKDKSATGEKLQKKIDSHVTLGVLTKGGADNQ